MACDQFASLYPSCAQETFFENSPMADIPAKDAIRPTKFGTISLDVDQDYAGITIAMKTIFAICCVRSKSSGRGRPCRPIRDNDT
jgi:hypothetical protein